MRPYLDKNGKCNERKVLSFAEEVKKKKKKNIFSLIEEIFKNKQIKHYIQFYTFPDHHVHFHFTDFFFVTQTKTFQLYNKLKIIGKHWIIGFYLKFLKLLDISPRHIKYFACNCGNNYRWKFSYTNPK